MARTVHHRITPKTMTSSLASLSPAIGVSHRRLLRGLSLITLFGSLVGVTLAQTDPNATDNANRRSRRAAQADASGDTSGNNRRGNFDPQQMQQQMLDRLRETLGVTDDAEWKIITDRLTVVMELRRNSAGGMRGGFRGGNPADANGGGGRRGSTGASPETDALRQAVMDKLPDAEIKSRMERLREVRKANEEKLTKAQEELRAVLSVRQEAVAVMYGLLP
jgi:hypothetical protein